MNDHSTRIPLRVGLISLGCAKNLVDAEIMLGTLLKDGIEIINDAKCADVVIVNTCSFIDSAQEESVDTILESAEVREAANRGQGLVVSGCLPQRFRNELPALFPEVDAFMGIDQVAEVSAIVKQAFARRADRLKNGKKSEVRSRKSGVRSQKSEVTQRVAKMVQESAKMPKAVNPRSDAPGPALLEVNSRPRYIPDFATPRFRLTPSHFAYVKIAEGCNHPCSFCIIPRMRGSHRSRPQPDVVAEARALLAEGVKELNLISQDTTYYGLDLRTGHTPAIASPEKFTAATKALAPSSTTLCTLLRELNALPGDFWIRLLYTHPAHWTDGLIQTIAECPKVARYVDMPLQHIHETMLLKMRRETSQDYIVNLLKKIRKSIPGIALRTTFIVGFPGETEENFEVLLDFIRETRFERLGVFMYSKEEGTVAGQMGAQIADKVKRRRREQAMAAQLEIAREISASFVGRTLKVLVEGKANGTQTGNLVSWEHGLLRDGTSRTAPGRLRDPAIARGEADAPDIDGRIFVRGSVEMGKFAQVRIIGHTDYDLVAEPV